MTDFDFTGEDLIDRWQIIDFELFKWIKNGLQPYNEHGLKIVDPTTDFGRKIMSSFKRSPDFGHVDKKLPESIAKSEDETELRQHLAAVLVSGLFKANNCEADLFDIPANKSKGDALIRRMKKWLFKTNDVFKFEKEHGLYKSSTIVASPPRMDPSTAMISNNGGNSPIMTRISNGLSLPVSGMLDVVAGIASGRVLATRTR